MALINKSWGSVNAPRGGMLMLVCTAAPLAAQSVDCSDPADMDEINTCMEQFYQDSDAILNIAYHPAMDQARQLGGYEQQIRSYVALMRDALRKWITFRDPACKADATLARGTTPDFHMIAGT